MQKVNAIGKVWKMKGRALHMAANTCEVVHRQRKGWEGRGEGGWSGFALVPCVSDQP